MSLPTPNLDDLRFQKDLVDEARRRIVHYCPEWTEYNVSDPGITLIELFAWMTEMIVYRLNQVPEKNYIKFLELLGIQLQPASSARTELTFWLSTPFPIAPEDETFAVVPQGTEVATQRTEEEREVVFTTDERLVIAPPRLTQLRRDADPDDFHRNYLSRLGVELFYAFDRESPQPGNTFYLGFDAGRDMSGHILQLRFQCEEVMGTGVRREDPPWVWECSVGNGRWEEVPPSNRPGERDTTGGLNNAEGQLVLYLPLSFKPDQVHGRNAYWIRCRYEPRRPEQGMYSESPRIQNIEAYTLGAATRATHAVVVRNEMLGRSNGEPGQTFNLEHAPVLDLQEGETVEVEEKRHGEVVFVPWTRVPDFSESDRYDRHFVLDTATGQVRFGPAIRQRDGSVRQYGRIPEAGRRIRFTRYRHGGGVIGNVPAGALTVLHSSIPYIDRVTNLRRASGGRDQETLEEAKMRARRELRTQQRAVTAQDYETLALGASRAVARVKCLAPGRKDRPPVPAGADAPLSSAASLPPGMVELLVVPAAFDALRVGDLTGLHLDPALQETVERHLDPVRLLTTTLRVREPRYLGIKVYAEIVPAEYSDPQAVRSRVLRLLRRFLTPLSLEDAAVPDRTEAEHRESPFGPHWEGWPFGRDLYLSELYSLVHQVPGVKHIWEIKLWRRPVIPAQEAEQPGQPPVLVEERMIPVPADTLLCSLDHEVKMVE